MMDPGGFFREWRRRRLVRHLAESPLLDYLKAPSPDGERPYDQCSFLALDLETSGLNPDRHEILSIGFAPLEQGRIRLSEAQHLLVRPERDIPAETAVIHGLTDDALAQGNTLEDAMTTLLHAMRERIIIAHFAHLERGFISKACRKLYGAAPPLPMVDTLALEHAIRTRADHPPREKELRLGSLRQRYGLPRYRAHNALSDAVATAELFLAQMASKGGGRGESLPISRLISW